MRNEPKSVIRVEEGIDFSREGDMIWQCTNSGHIVIGKKAPEMCPDCNHEHREASAIRSSQRGRNVLCEREQQFSCWYRQKSCIFAT